MPVDVITDACVNLIARPFYNGALVGKVEDVRDEWHAVVVHARRDLKIIPSHTLVIVQTAQNDVQLLRNRSAHTGSGDKAMRPLRRRAVKRRELATIRSGEPQIQSGFGGDLKIITEQTVQLLDIEIPLAIGCVNAEPKIVRVPPRIAQKLENVALKTVGRIVSAFGHAPAVAGVDPDGALREKFQAEVRNLLAQVVITEPEGEVRPQGAVVIKPPDVGVKTVPPRFIRPQ